MQKDDLITRKELAAVMRALRLSFKEKGDLGRAVEDIAECLEHGVALDWMKNPERYSVE